MAQRADDPPMMRASNRVWIGLCALAGVWVVTYWLTPGPDAPVVSTPEQLRSAAHRVEPDGAGVSGGDRGWAVGAGGGPLVTVVPPPNHGGGAGAGARSGSGGSRERLDEADGRAARPGVERDGAAGDGLPRDSGSQEPAAMGVIPPTFQFYTVRSGDTLSMIAEQFFGTTLYAGQIARANPTIDPVRLRAGVELKIPVDPRNIQGIPADPSLQPDEPEPAFIEYVVSRGDTLSEIARSIYGRSGLWTHIRDANPQINRDATNLRPGMTIRIPPPPR